MSPASRTALLSGNLPVQGPTTAQPAVAAAVALYGACVQLDIALAANRPPVVEFRVAGASPLLPLVARLYPGQDVWARAQDLLALNRIPNPLWIPTGTLLRVPRPPASA